METKDKVEEPEKKKRGRPRKTEEEKREARRLYQQKRRAEAKKEAEKATEEPEKPKRGGVGSNGNLIPLNQRTKEEQRAIVTKAGIASGVARRRKKELREFTRDFLMQEAVPQLKGNMSMLGVEAEQMTNIAAMVTRLFSKAVNQGDLNAARTIIEWAGMAPLQEARENEAIARMSQIVQLASGKEEEEEEQIVFYIPDNQRAVVINEGNVEE